MTEPAAHKPFIPADAKGVPELTIRAVLVGAVLGILFAASSVYLALKVGLTVSASIPIAVLSITVFRQLRKMTREKGSAILENNIVQTTGSAGESLAAAIAFVLPSLLLMGYELEVSQVLLVALLGGVLGVFLMIPLRQGLIVEEHGKLPYPEGTACAEVLVVGEKGGTSAARVFTGLGVGIVYNFLAKGLKLFSPDASSNFRWFRGGSFSAELTPELLGVGYIIGPRIASVMMAGGVLGYLVIVPAIALFGGGLDETMFPANKLIRDMGPMEIRSAYALYIGAGGVATGGLISLARAVPSIIRAFRGGLATLRASRAGGPVAHVVRTARDLPITVVIFGCLALVIAMWAIPSLRVNLLSAVLILVFGFLFTTVSSRITGELGSSSNPISGMTVATILGTCLLFLLARWTGSEHRAAVIILGAIVCTAASNGGTTSQDLKTGFLVGATPRSQQIAILVGVVTSALVIGSTLKLLNDAYTNVVPRDFGAAVVSNISSTREEGPDHRTYRVGYQRESGSAIPQGRYLVDDDGHVRFLVDPGIGGTVTCLRERPDGSCAQPTTKLSSPKAQLFSLLVDGILTQKLPWALVLMGVFIAVSLELCGIAALPFAVGIYLPFSTSTTIFFGGVARWLVERRRKRDGVALSDTEAESSPGTLLSSGYIAGGAIAGLVLAGLEASGSVFSPIDLARRAGNADTIALWESIHASPIVSYGCFGVLVAVLLWVGTRKDGAAPR